MRSRLLVLPLGLLLLTGCASSPQTEVRQDVRAVLAAANDEDADAVRSAVEDLLSTLRTQVGSGDLTDAEATPVRDAAVRIRDSVAALEQVEPTPTPEPTPEPTQVEEPSPTPSPTPPPSPTPTPTPTPEPTQEQPAPTTPPATQPPPAEEPDENEVEPPEDGGEDGGGGEGEDEQATAVPPAPAAPSSTPGS